MSKRKLRPPSMMEVMPYQVVGKINETITKARLRVFHLGENVNGSFITKEFAENLLKTIPYCPTKGIYDQGAADFLGHDKPDSGRIYGVVPENPNLSWEDIRDEDGILQTYACVDVYLYTALYKEAGDIVGKAQSMELFPESIEGEWTILDGIPIYTYSRATFLGLQVLGDDRTPCFPDSAFFEENKDKGTEEMVAFLFTKVMEMEKMLDKDKKEVFEEEVKEPMAEETAEETTVAEAVVEEPVAEAAVEEEAVVEEPVVEEPVAEEPAVEEPVVEEPVVEETATDYETKIFELEELTSTLQSEIETMTKQTADLTSELESLREFKQQSDRKEKRAVIAKYESRLESTVLDGFRDKIDEYTAEELAKELAFQLVETNADFALPAANYTLNDSSGDDDDSLTSYLLSRKMRKKKI